MSGFSFQSGIEADAVLLSIFSIVGFSSTSIFTLNNCSVEKCTITGPESVGGLVGTCGYGTVTIKNCSINHTNLTSNKNGTYRIGYAIGTVPNAGTVSLTNISFADGTVTQLGSTGFSDATCTQLVGRSWGNVTGDGSTIAIQQIIANSRRNGTSLHSPAE